MKKNREKSPRIFYANKFCRIFSAFTASPSQLTFTKTLSRTFPFWTFLKMSIFKKLAYFFFGVFIRRNINVLKIDEIKVFYDVY
jgi:hypothetical protein